MKNKMVNFFNSMSNFLIFMCIFFFFLALYTACSGKCIKIGGRYKEFGGDIEYCFSQTESKVEGVPVLIGKEGDKIFGLNNIQIKKINTLFNKNKIGIKTRKSKLTPCQFLLKILKNEKSKK